MSGIQEDHISAAYNNGVLELTLPKAQPVVPAAPRLTFSKACPGRRCSPSRAFFSPPQGVLPVGWLYSRPLRQVNSGKTALFLPQES